MEVPLWTVREDSHHCLLWPTVSLPELHAWPLGEATGQGQRWPLMLTVHIQNTLPQRSYRTPLSKLAQVRGRPALHMRWGGLCGLRKGHRWVSGQPAVRGVGTEARAAALTKTWSLGGKDQRKASPWGGDHQELPFSPIPRPPLKTGPLPNSPSPSRLHLQPHPSSLLCLDLICSLSKPLEVPMGAGPFSQHVPTQAHQNADIPIRARQSSP